VGWPARLPTTLRIDRYFMMSLSLYVSFSNLQGKMWSYIEEALLSDDNASGDSAFISTVKEEEGANIAEKDDQVEEISALWKGKGEQY
jgi:hypothetical protein